MKDYFAILGVSRQADEAEVRAAYRRLAKATHPDTAGVGSAPRFREVCEAYEFLCDPQRREAHAAGLGGRRRGGGGGQAPPPWGRAAGRPWQEVRTEPLSPWESLARMLRSQSFRHPNELDFDLRMSPAEAAQGGRVPLEINLPRRCVRCGGQGVDWRGPCPTCRGAGLSRQRHFFTLEIPPGLRSGSILEAPLGGPWPDAAIRLRVIIDG